MPRRIQGRKVYVWDGRQWTEKRAGRPKRKRRGGPALNWWRDLRIWWLYREHQDWEKVAAEMGYKLPDDDPDATIIPRLQKAAQRYQRFLKELLGSLPSDRSSDQINVFERYR